MNFSISGVIPLQSAGESPAPAPGRTFATPSGLLVDCPASSVSLTVSDQSGCCAVFCGAPVTEQEAMQWLADFASRGWNFLADISKPVSVFAWHPGRREAVVAVDRYRINWIYWKVKKDRLYFASTLRELLAASQDRLELDSEALYCYLDLLCVPAELAIQREVQKLGGGSCLRVTDGKLELLRYHQLSYRDKYSADEAALAGEARRRIEGAVQRQLSWIPESSFGCFLSGGTDSSSLLGCSYLTRGAGVPAYSVTFQEDSWDELEFAKIAAQKFQARHQVIQFEMEDALRISELLGAAHNEPMGNSSLLATFKCVERAAQDGIRYLVAGDGGDEIFGGNERYAIDAVYSRFHAWTPGPLRRGLKGGAGLLSLLTGHRRFGQIERILARADRPNPERYYLDDAFAFKIYPDAFRESFAEQVNPRANLERFSDYYRNASAAAEIDRLLFVDMRHTLGDNDLVKVGISGRANHVGILYPMLDHELVDFACRLPVWAKLKGKEKRYLFKIAMSDLVPGKILYKKKQGFGVPISHWLRSSPKFLDRYRQVVFDRGGLALELLEERFLATKLREHQSGLLDHGMFLWGLFALNLWAHSARSWGRGGGDAA